MSTQTTNLKLVKPDGNDTADIGIINGNMDIIDAQVANKVDKVSGKGLSTNDYTSTEKTKLAGIATGAQVNQNAFSNIKVGTTTVSADSATDTLELVAGTNITLTPDATNDKITITAAGYTHPSSHPASMITAADGTTMEDFKANTETQMAEITQDITDLGTSKVNSNNYVANNAYAVTGGTSIAYTVTLNPAPTAYVDGMSITIVPNVDCGASPTLNINSLGATPLLKSDGSAFAAGELKANKPYCFVRVGSSFFIRNTGGNNIKSIQRGTAILPTNTLSIDIPISTIDASKSIVLISPYGMGSENPSVIALGIFIQTTTSIRIAHNTKATQDIEFAYQVIEFNNVKSIQSGTFTCSTAGIEQTITINNINPNKSILFSSFNTNCVTPDPYAMLTQVRIINENTLGFKVLIPTVSFFWRLIEFN